MKQSRDNREFTIPVAGNAQRLLEKKQSRDNREFKALKKETLAAAGGSNQEIIESQDGLNNLWGQSKKKQSRDDIEYC